MTKRKHWSNLLSRYTNIVETLDPEDIDICDNAVLYMSQQNPAMSIIHIVELIKTSVCCGCPNRLFRHLKGRCWFTNLNHPGIKEEVVKRNGKDVLNMNFYPVKSKEEISV